MATYEEIAAIVQQRYEAFLQVERECLALFDQIAEGYRTLLNEVAIRHAELRTICYAYDFPRPTYKGGKYIGQYLDDMGYPKDKWDAVGAVIIDRLSNAIAGVVASFPNAIFLDCRHVTAKYPFYDDMHPNTEGFKVLAGLFEAKLLGARTVRTPARTLRRRPSARGAASRRSAKQKGVRQPAQRRARNTARGGRRSTSTRTDRRGRGTAK